MTTQELQDCGAIRAIVADLRGKYVTLKRDHDFQRSAGPAAGHGRER